DRVRRIENSRLAFCEHGIAESDEVIPERDLPLLQAVRIEELLGKEIAVKIPADESVPPPQRAPEQQGEPHSECQHSGQLPDKHATQLDECPAGVNRARAEATCCCRTRCRCRKGLRDEEALAVRHQIE